MGNRRLTLAFPPYTISPMGSQRSLSRYPGSMRAEDRSNCRKELEFQSKSPAAISVHDHSDWLEVDMDDWLSSDCFPPLSSKRKSPAMAFGLPKHSQLNDSDRVERLCHCNLPSVVAVDPNSIAIGNLPIHFSWNSKVGDVLSGDDMIKSIEQIVHELQQPLSHNDLQPPPLVNKEISSGARSSGKSSDKTQTGKKMKSSVPKNVNGPAQPGLSIADLFSHSYSPPSSKAPKTRSSRWEWVAAARVWDPATERFPASVSDIRKFGAQAKHLRRVRPSTTDGRSFVEVAMDKRQFQGREVRDGDRSREFRDGERFYERSREGHDGRDGYQGPRWEGWDYQSRDGRGPRAPPDQGNKDPRQGRQPYRGQEQWEFQNRKRAGDHLEERDVRQMTEEDLRHKIEERRRGYNVQQNWDSGAGQSSGLAMKCFNCNDYGHHQSTCKKPRSIIVVET